MEFKIETNEHIISVTEEYIIIQKIESEEEPIIRKIEELDTIHKIGINSIYPIIKLLIDGQD
mgnify:CR=1 FL=1